MKKLKLKDILKIAIQLLEMLADEDECEYDHHGYCQVHGWMDSEVECPHKQVKQFLEMMKEDL